MKWIKFSDRWPDGDSNFLFYDASIGSMHVANRLFPRTVLTRLYCSCSDCILDIEEQDDYWMPLPEKPDEEP